MTHPQRVPSISKWRQICLACPTRNKSRARGFIVELLKVQSLENGYVLLLSNSFSITSHVPSNLHVLQSMY
eukprot:12298630-Prorocentrum_lima.AAC.1